VKGFSTEVGHIAEMATDIPAKLWFLQGQDLKDLRYLMVGYSRDCGDYTRPIYQAIIGLIDLYLEEQSERDRKWSIERKEVLEGRRLY